MSYTPPLKKILLVDDQQSIRSIAQLALGKLGGFTLHACASAEEALKEANDFEPDLLLVDVGMPGEDGTTTLKRLREQGVAAPAVFFALRSNHEDLSRFQVLGAIGTVHKPFDPLKLGKQLRAIWKQFHDPGTGPPH